ncbi:MAG: hypothetical protein VB857_12780 [Pirellulaceae bacterium]
MNSSSQGPFRTTETTQSSPRPACQRVAAARFLWYKTRHRALATGRQTPV